MYVYILYSSKRDKYYTGQTSDVKDRLHRHNAGWEKSTKHGKPRALIWYKKCSTRSEAVRLETKIKKRGARRYLKEIDSKDK